jgi:hypothetical protein
MVNVAKMLGCMFVFGRVAATYVATLHAQAQVNPGVAELHALFANMYVSAGDFDLIQMLTFD